MTNPSIRDRLRFDRTRAGIALTVVSSGLLSACAIIPAASQPAQVAVSDERLGDICATQLSFDVTGPYFANCRNFLRSHSIASIAVPKTESVPAEHRACREIGLAEDSTSYKNCVQELNLLDVSSDHL